MGDFDSMTHEQIYKAVQAGQTGAVQAAAQAIKNMHSMVGQHMDALNDILKKLDGAWTDPTGDRLYKAMSGTVDYVQRIGQQHVVTSSGSLVQVLSTAHEQLSTTKANMPAPPAVPVATQEKQFNQRVDEQDGAMSMGTAQMLSRISQAKADDKKAVEMGNKLAETYKTEAAKMNTPEPAPNTSPNTGGTSSGAVGPSATAHHSHGTTAAYVQPTGTTGGKQHPPKHGGGKGHIEWPPLPGPGGGTDGGGGGNVDLTGGVDGQGGGQYDDLNLGGSSSGGFPGGVIGAGAVALGGAAALAAARQLAMQRAAMAGETEAMALQRQAALNAQQRGILSAEQRMLAQQRAMAMNAERNALTAEERAMLGGRGVVPGQIGGTRAGAVPPGAMGRRGGYSPHGVVGGEDGDGRVTWLVEDRDPYAVDPGVKPVIDE